MIRRINFFLAFIALFHFAFAFPASASDNGTAETLFYLKNLSIEQLASLEVTTVSKTEEKMADADAAIYVITSEDIRRSGLTSIPELLRMVPGMDVARINGNKWAISCRGFNAWFANKLLVLIDGRSVYTPLFSGVYWDVQDTFLDDIDRIEVIRGPGATLWGANAVNGVINIITKKAKQTQGTEVNAGYGNIQKGFGGARYGGRIGKNIWYRAYAKYFNRDSFKQRNGRDAGDNWDQGRGGFRMDWNLSHRDSLTLEGDIFVGKSYDDISNIIYLQKGIGKDRAKTDVSGGDILGRWTRKLSDTSDFSLQWYYDHSYRGADYLEETRDTIDIDFQHHFHALKRHDIVWGLGYRLTWDHIPPSLIFDFEESRRTDNLFSSFIQDKITLVPRLLDVTLGTKLEHNDYTGFEVQPSIRFRLKPTKAQTFWAAVSRAVRTPSRADHDMLLKLRVFQTGPTVNTLALVGNNDFHSEKLIAYEAGYRYVPEKRFSFDIATFYNVYRDLRTSVRKTPIPPFTTVPPPASRLIPIEIENQYHEDSYGVEITGTVQLASWWKTSLSYTWLKLRLHSNRNPGDSELGDKNIPRNQFSLKSYMDLPYNLQLDTLLFYVDKLENLQVPGYTRLDLRLGWNPVKHLSLSLKLENLLDNRHPEYVSVSGITATEVPRSVYGKLTWNF